MRQMCTYAWVALQAGLHSERSERSERVTGRQAINQ